MKAHQPPIEPEFRPVILTLESQAEVNAIYALLNHVLIREASELPSNIGAVLKPFVTYANGRIHTNLCNLFRK